MKDIEVRDLDKALLIGPSNICWSTLTVVEHLMYS